MKHGKRIISLIDYEILVNGTKEEKQCVMDRIAFSNLIKKIR